MNRCALPPHSRSTFPQGLEHHYLASLKVEDDPAGAPYGFPVQHATDYPSTPLQCPCHVGLPLFKHQLRRI